ncbi:hypothetical protein RJ639_012370 [Escallonia herrerae]|uniref:GDSL esterase/lipase n=1 Tax=Escallonia herrerae TaxID=1293975 RepID=A0AA89AR63_9ASTE|nr:hypothetical protein RJ639_012370 [Escallonia herrerae]
MGLSSHRQIAVGILFETMSALIWVRTGLAGGFVPASFIFGDSLVDAGNNNYISTLSFGLTIYRMVSSLARQQGDSPTEECSSHGSCKISYNYNSVHNQLGCADRQLQEYHKRHDLKYWCSAAVKLPERALFSVTVGTNYLLDNYLPPIGSTARQRLLPPETFVGTMISRLRLQLLRLYMLGARKIVVANLGLIGCIPFQRDSNPSSGLSCVDFSNELAQLFNIQLRSLVAELNTSLKGSNFVYADVYHIVEDILQNYKSYGFENVHSSCCSMAGRFGGLVPCLSPSKVCSDRSKYIFWDAYHPTEAANIIIAKRLMDGDLDDIYPLNIRHLIDS